MEYIKKHKVPAIIIAAVVVIVVAAIIFFTVMAKSNEVVTNPITFQEKYADAENKINNIITTSAKREGYKTDLMAYTDKVKQDYNMTVEDKDAFLTLTRKIDDEYIKSKMHVLSFYGKVKKQYELDVMNGYFKDDVKAKIDALFVEYNTIYKEGKYLEAYNKLDEISKHLSVRITEDGVEVDAQQAAAAAPVAETQQNTDTQQQQPQTEQQTTSNATGKGYHPEATAGQEVVDPNNGNVGVVADNGIEVYKLPNESTYSYITKEEFIAMLVRTGTREELAKIWADQMANEQGLITIGVDDDGSYE
ncbi:MAG: hypothetical protein K5644_02090 [Lachnospiraceae bacterium]|nr:hypothetical protein [Lachnospiraceae bacterium]